MNFSEFKIYSEALSLLEEDVLSKLCTIVFSKRENVLSVCAITEDEKTYKKLLKGVKLPNNFLCNDYITLGVDLESISSDKIRVYKWFSKEKSIRIEGLYITKDGEILERKLYKQVSKNELSINRYNSSGKIISEKEIEKDCSEDEWTGPKKIVEEALKNSYDINFIRKTFKNQTYCVIHAPF